jgi:hypothetical protein
MPTLAENHSTDNGSVRPAHSQPAQRARDFFKTNNEFVDSYLLAAPLTFGHVKLYLMLLRRFDNRRNEADMSQVEMAARLGVSERWVRSLLSDLKALGLIVKGRRGHYLLPDLEAFSKPTVPVQTGSPEVPVKPEVQEFHLYIKTLYKTPKTTRLWKTRHHMNLNLRFRFIRPHRSNAAMTRGMTARSPSVLDGTKSSPSSSTKSCPSNSNWACPSPP